MRSLKNITFNVLVDETTRKMLEEVAAACDLSCAQVIRESIRWRFAMQIAGVPTCTNGRPCFVPHMHAIPGRQASILNPQPALDHPADVIPNRKTQPNDAA